MDLPFCICKLAFTFYMINEIQPKRNFKMFFKAPLNWLNEEIYCCDFYTIRSVGMGNDCMLGFTV